MNRFFIHVSFVLLTCLPGILSAQAAKRETEDPQEMFVSAQSDFLYEDYAEALPTYMRLLKLFPENDHFRYKIGICLLNDPFQKEKSIDYLEKAVKNTSKDFKDNSIKENRAPTDAWFYLGNAYRVNLQLTKALEAYQKFREVLDPKVYDLQVVDEQITATKNAQRLIKEPMDVDFRDLGEPINSRYSELNPVVSGDEKSMLFVRQTAFQPQVFYSLRKGDEWTDPASIMFEIGSDGDLFPTSLSFDGKEAIFYGNDNMLGTLYSSKLVNGAWTKAKPLNDKINTKYWESHGCLSADGKTLYFTSNRKGGLGGLDIYKSSRQAGGDWGTPENLGANVNTRYNEETPFVTEDGLTLYFSSYGHFNMGGYDVYYTNRMDDGSWTTPLNAGYPINTTEDDVFFVPIKEGTIAYMPRFDQKSSLGKMDIYRFDIYSSMHPRKFRLKGIVRLEGDANPGTNPVTVQIFDRIKAETLKVITLNKEAGDYALDLPAGEYDLMITSKGFLPRIEKLVVSKNSDPGDLSINSRLEAEEKKMQEGKEIRQAASIIRILGPRELKVTSGEPLRIKLEVEQGSILDVIATVDAKAYRAEKLQANRKSIIYIYPPKPGNNLLLFTLTGLDNKITRDSLHVLFENGDSIPADSLYHELTPAELARLLKSMQDHANGRLKQYLDSLDLSREKIGSSLELVKHLLDNAAKSGYTEQDVLNLLSDLTSQMPMQEYLDLLISHSEGNLRSTLLGINLEADRINTPWELTQYLLQQAGAKAYSATEVRHLLARVGSLDTPKPTRFLQKLLAFSDDSLRSFLATLVKNASRLKDNLQLTDQLYDKAVQQGMSAESLDRLLTKVASSYPLKDYLGKLLPFANQNLRKFMESLNLDKLGLFTARQLLSYLIQNAEKGGYTLQDVLDMLMRYAASRAPELPVVSPAPAEQLPEVSAPRVNTTFIYSLGGLLGLGFLLFIFLLLWRRKKKK